jgi:type VI protein secretion system component Hcp
MLTKLEFSGDGNEQSLEETVGLSFAEFRMDYKLQGDSGTAQGSKSFQFNVQRQIGSS